MPTIVQVSQPVTPSAVDVEFSSPVAAGTVDPTVFSVGGTTPAGPTITQISPTTVEIASPSFDPDSTGESWEAGDDFVPGFLDDIGTVV